MKYMKYSEPLINQSNCGRFTEEETNYIYNWVANHLRNYDMIRWENLQLEIQKIYGKFRWQYDLRNIWNSRGSHNLRQNNAKFCPPVYEDDERAPQSNSKEEEVNCIDPLINQVNYDPFSEDEKNYVYNWVTGRLQLDIRKNYGKHRLRNDLRNIWNRIKRQILRRDSIDENDEINHRH
ncbi:hypothetical protein RclHR1_05530003 [Rhizophagus clarus]|uniref:Myb-like domain-containing protein n=1 Tax=Rhizophagus clarus TaxID=94130 RepID=A0A2Z6RNS7_9GLOM|nr:hypothetical protein RclHR1_05530003 [Rhizophagus clarus]GET03687.1 hypothetical protein GLOIN_2v1482814 [Rhizophagus clarus]